MLVNYKRIRFLLIFKKIIEKKFTFFFLFKVLDAAFEEIKIELRSN